jgi:hypothetical protein
MATKEALRNTGIKSTIIRQQGQTIHPTGMQKILMSAEQWTASSFAQ